MEKFYDSIDLMKLSDLAEQASYPMHVFIYDMFYQLAPRVLRWYSAYSEPIPVSRGILAGSRRGNTFARVVLYPIIHKIHYNIPHSLSLESGVHVDDIAQSLRYSSSLSSSRDIVADAVRVGKMLVTSIQAQNLIISSKSVIVSSSKSLAREVSDQLAKQGIKIVAQDAGRDLGLDAGAGARRRVAIQTSRAAKGKMRALKLRFLQRCTASRRTRRFSVQTFGPPLRTGPLHMGAAIFSCRRCERLRQKLCSRNLDNAQPVSSHWGLDNTGSRLSYSCDRLSLSGLRPGNLQTWSSADL